MLAEVAGVATTSWPLGLTLAVAVGGERLRERRRRTMLNRALHELRRPLQSLVLAGAPEPRVRQALELTVAALGDLDREINRGSAPLRRRPVCAASIVHAAVERWRAQAAARDRSLTLRCHIGEALIDADPIRLAMALDNLIANALEHGTLRVEVVATLGGRGLRVAVADAGCARRQSRRPPRRRDPRHGHGLAVVAGVAREHGGRFVSFRSERGSIAVLELPLAERAA